MRINFSAQDTTELFEGLSHQTGATLVSEERGQILKFFPCVGDGWMQSLRLRPGLELVVESLKFQEQSILKTEYTDKFPSIGISFFISGHARVMVNGAKQEASFSPGQCGWGFPANSEGAIEYSVGQRNTFITIYVEPLTLSTLIDSQFKQLPTQLQQIINCKNQSFYFQTCQMTSAMKMATGQILTSPYHALMKQLYQESKAIELIALYLQQLSLNSEVTAKSPVLRADDIDRIYQAREIIVQQLDNPPSLLHLARQVGLNDYKLKWGFRQVFGTTVFSYLKNYRLEQARQLLEEETMMIAEVADAVGFANRSYFAAAFRHKFGVNPSSYRAVRRGSKLYFS